MKYEFAINETDHSVSLYSNTEEPFINAPSWPMTAKEARETAIALLRAAEELDKLTRKVG